MVDMPNVIECKTIEEANKIDLKYYKFIGLSESRGWCYHIRSKKKEE